MKVKYDNSMTYSYMKMSLSMTKNIVGVSSMDLNKYNYLPIKRRKKTFYYPVPKVDVDTMFDCGLEAEIPR